MTMDKSLWGPGPWQDEPDEELWTDEATGLRCRIKRTPLGHLCGYVGVTKNHPWHGVGYRQAEDEFDIDVHGGVTWADTFLNTPGIWWIGFDCAHWGDASPGEAARLRQAAAMVRESGLPVPYFMTAEPSVWETGPYKTIAYVRAECLSLAQQIAAVPRPPRWRQIRKARYGGLGHSMTRKAAMRRFRKEAEASRRRLAEYGERRRAEQ